MEYYVRYIVIGFTKESGQKEIGPFKTHEEAAYNVIDIQGFGKVFDVFILTSQDRDTLPAGTWKKS